MKRRPMTTTGTALVLATTYWLAGCSAGGDTDEEGVNVPGVHMAALSADFTKVYLTSSETHELIVVDALSLDSDTSDAALEERAYVVSEHSGDLTVIDLRDLSLITTTSAYDIIKRVALGAHPTHLSLSPDGSFLAVMDEDEGAGAVSFIDTRDDTEIKRLEGFYTPHFMRFSPDGRYGYVANLGAHHVTRVDLESLEIDGYVALDGYEVPPNVSTAEDEGGFADAQIDADGVLYAASRATGRVIVYDTVAREKRMELPVGDAPWVAFAEHPFKGVAKRYVVPNFGDRTLSLIDGARPEVVASLPGDEEAYGVNFSPLTPDKVFVMNRVREDVAVVDTANGRITQRIPVGGNTETAATSADGRYVVAAVSGANSAVVIDAVTNEVLETFDAVGDYPWSVTIPKGQNYCH